MKNRTLIGIVCIVLAVVMVFAVTPLINKMSEPKTTVVRVTKDVARGAVLNPDMLEEVKISTNLRPNDASTYNNKNFAAADKYYTTCDMKAGDIVTSKKISTEANDINNTLNSLDGSHVAMSIKIGSNAAALTGKLESGDIVSLCITTRKNNVNVTTIPLAFKYVRVLTTTTSNGIDEDQIIKNDDGSYTMPSTITVLVTPRQAALLASYNASAIHFVLVHRGDEEVAEKYLAAEDEYLGSLENAAKESAKTMMSHLVSDDKAFNEYYEAHHDEFLAMMEKVFEQVFGMNIESQADTNIYDDSQAQQEAPSQETPSAEQPVENPQQETPIDEKPVDNEGE